MKTMQRRLAIELEDRKTEAQIQRWNNSTPHPMLFLLILHGAACLVARL